MTRVMLRISLQDGPPRVALESGPKHIVTLRTCTLYTEHWLPGLHVWKALENCGALLRLANQFAKKKLDTRTNQNDSFSVAYFAFAKRQIEESRECAWKSQDA